MWVEKRLPTLWGGPTGLGPAGSVQESHGSGVGPQHGAQEPAEEEEEARRALGLTELEGGSPRLGKLTSPCQSGSGGDTPGTLKQRLGTSSWLSLSLSVKSIPAQGHRLRKGHGAKSQTQRSLSGCGDKLGATSPLTPPHRHPVPPHRDAGPTSPSWPGREGAARAGLPVPRVGRGTWGGTHLFSLQQPTEEQLVHDVLAQAVQGLAGLGERRKGAGLSPARQAAVTGHFHMATSRPPRAASPYLEPQEI